jgi:hypothetical protein
MTSTLRTPPAPQPAPEPAPPGAADRVLARRPALPGGRAVLGALLVVGAGIGTFALAAGGDDAPTTAYPVLVRPVDPGEPLAGDAVEWRAMELDPEVEARTFVEQAELADVVALAPLAPGELVQRSQVTGRGTGADALGGQVSIPVPVDRTPPDLRRGERVAVLATYGSGADATTIVTVGAATVLAHDTKSEAIGSSATSRLTLALDDPSAVVATAHASQVAELTIVRTSGATSALPESYRREAALPSRSTLDDDTTTGSAQRDG